MQLEIWQIVAVACTAVGAAALVIRQALQVASERQLRRLARDGDELERWWNLVAELPGDALPPDVRRTIGGIMHGILTRAGRPRPGHAGLDQQRRRIAHFVAQGPLGHVSRGGRTRRETLAAALRALLIMLRDAARERLVAGDELDAARRAVSRRLDELEFLQAQHAAVPADRLRRMTRALGPGNALGDQPR